jgi:hypothetical protein
MTSAKGVGIFSVHQQEKWNMVQVRELVHNNRDLTIHELVNVTGVSSGSSQNLKNMTTAKSMPHLPTKSERSC